MIIIAWGAQRKRMRKGGIVKSPQDLKHLALWFLNLFAKDAQITISQNRRNDMKTPSMEFNILIIATAFLAMSLNNFFMGKDIREIKSIVQCEGK